MTRSELTALLRKHPHLTPTEASIKVNIARVSASNPQPAQGRSLERAVSGEETSSTGIGRRYKIVFRIFGCRPADWDGYSIKEIQDMVVHAGILPSDDWATLQGEVQPCKVHTKAEEKTVIEIYDLSQEDGLH